MHPFDEMKSWVEFTTADEENLRAFAPIALPNLRGMADRFYAKILAHPGAAGVLRDEAQVARLKTTLVQWSEELLLGPWDNAYFLRRERIGRRHVEVGLAARYMFTAMHTWRDALCELARERLPEAQALATCTSLARVTDIDLATMTGTYVRRREEAQLQTLRDVLVSHLPVTVLLLDADGVVTAATRADIRLFGATPAIGRHWTQALPLELVEAGDLIPNLMRAQISGREIALPRVDVDLDGASRSFRFALVPLEHPQARALIHIEELTDAIHTETRLRRAETLAQLGSMSAAMAHELRNPLAGISGAVQVIAASLPAGDSRRSVMEKVEQQVRRLDLLVGELLDFARPPQPRATEVALGDAARAVVDLARRTYPAMAFNLEGEGDAWADPQLVQHILLNLVLNGAQASLGDRDGATTAGNVRVRIEGGRVEVWDDGRGVAAGQEQRIFEPFFTTRTRGTGLGLAICRKMAQAMHGSVSVLARDAKRPAPLPGACFVLELPAPGQG